MYEFGDEVIIDSYRIPWLIWIQLLALFLLVILVYYFTSSTPSSSDDLFPITTTVSPSSATVNHSFLISSPPSTLHNLKVRENEIRETGTSTSGLVQRARKPDAEQREGSSTSSESSGMMFDQSHHPCNFFGLAKQAFLKCLGIDSSPESSIKRPHEKDD